MKKILGICNLHDGPHLGGLTEKRPLGSVTFLGRYGLMDITLSNFTNSGIDNVVILCDEHMYSVQRHLQNGNVWIRNTKTGFQRVFFDEPSFQSKRFNTDINNILYNRDLFEEFDSDYVVVAPAFFLMSMDYRKVVEAHEKSGKACTVVYTHCLNAAEKYLNCDTIRIRDGEVIGTGNVTSRTDEAYVSLEVFVFNRKEFNDLLEESRKVSELFNIRDMIAHFVNDLKSPANAYEYEGYVAPILSLNDYVRYSFDMLDYKTRCGLFREDWPIYTSTHNTPPALYGPKADVTNSFIANGCVINGTVKNSIISRDVTVEEGAVVENCILFTKTVVGKKVTCRYVLSDKNTVIRTATKVEGDGKNILYIAKGAHI